MRRLAFVAALLAQPVWTQPVWVQPAAAQPAAAGVTVTPDQISAIRSNCRRDFLLNCSGVPRGGKEAFLCLRNNQGKLTEACSKAVAAVQ